MSKPKSIKIQARDIVKKYAIDVLGYNSGSMYLPVLWGKKRYEEWTGDWAGSNYIGAIVFEDSDWSAIAWAGKLQQELDPNYEQVLFEPYTDYILTIYKEG